ncbi:DegV family protein [Anaerosalibacter massiliensis]|uniref:DegV family protein n=1 Tax=Anaerosalibacter massiliensis TaxID=1347392 RepID=A0A9X2S5Y2_9FIRM|nr:DegV family protein [Anaerosalibacter massiliensis]MCR2045043.1 DegV family protein [Anaerosalibacter massiliensis]
MEYKIVSDSSCDLNEELKEQMNIGLVPLKINIDDKSLVDDENLDVSKLLTDMKNSKDHVRTSSPSPGDFLKEYEKKDNIFVVTLSSQLSGTYNAAILAKNIIADNMEKFIHVFDSKTASIGETLITMKIFELIQKQYNKLDIVNKVEEYIDGLKTFFILENLDNLIKGGRMTKIAGHIASILSIKPIMGSDKDGNIKLVDKIRGTKRAFKRLVDIIGEEGNNFENKILGISHCNAEERAIKLKDEISKRYNFKDIIVVEMAGLSSVYANDGGIVIAF